MYEWAKLKVGMRHFCFSVLRSEYSYPLTIERLSQISVSLYSKLNCSNGWLIESMKALYNGYDQIFEDRDLIFLEFLVNISSLEEWLSYFGHLSILYMSVSK